MHGVQLYKMMIVLPALTCSHNVQENLKNGKNTFGIATFVMDIMHGLHTRCNDDSVACTFYAYPHGGCFLNSYVLGWDSYCNGKLYRISQLLYLEFRRRLLGFPPLQQIVFGVGMIFGHFLGFRLF
ncbi:hypothetical protein NMG60_11015833 [Bertholletia excelsa]